VCWFKAAGLVFALCPKRLARLNSGLALSTGYLNFYVEVIPSILSAAAHLAGRLFLDSPFV
jgi:hypothetical protein